VQVFEGILRAAGDPMGLFVNYRQLPEAVLGVCSHSGIAFTAEEREQTLEAAKTNAERPGFSFQDDSQEKRAEASPCLRELIAERLYPLYRALEALASWVPSARSHSARIGSICERHSSAVENSKWLGAWSAASAVPNCVRSPGFSFSRVFFSATTRAISLSQASSEPAKQIDQLKTI
jgi:hypothetical protein